MNTPSRSQRARTKIIATIGPACRTLEKMAELVVAGVDVFRLNMAHATREVHAETLSMIRQTGRELRRPIAVLVDLAGPKIRLGQLIGDAIECELGAEFRMVRGGQARAPGELVTSYAPLVDELNVGDTVMLADGTVGMKVVEKTADAARCKVFQSGTIRSRQG
ncbi:MAG: pyruvate kinase, partial [Pirellulales bacterium]